MTPLPQCTLYSRDEELVDRLLRIAAPIAVIQPIDAQEDLEQWLSQFGDSVLLADLRAPNCLDVLTNIQREKPATVLIVMGADRSDPMLAAEFLEPYAMISLEPDRREFKALLKQAANVGSLCFADELSVDALSQKLPSTDPASSGSLGRSALSASGPEPVDLSIRQTADSDPRRP